MSTEAKKKPEKKAQEKKEEAVERGVLGVVGPSMDDVKEYVKTVKVLTPSSLAERFKVRVSVAKAVLKELAAKGIVKEVIGTNRIRIYAPLSAPAPTEQKTVQIEAKPKKAKKSSKQSASAPQAEPS
ncbi:MAG: 40S ribosomal protein S25 [Candidatus Caldarchaeum sp.]|nr:40S ribosomal protein S25 [Candidatus Caldarchaeum sp.]MDW8436060.1 eS25 family ribosomal protein [Candidatus Caldarchaeum sp.]